MKVVFLPFDTLNPYQAELVQALKEEGVAVLPFTPCPTLPLLSCLWKTPQVDIVHLHWLSGFLIKPSLWKSLFWSALFLFEVLILKLFRKKLVWTVHNLLEHERRHARLELFFLKRLAKLWDSIIVHSLYAQEQVADVLDIQNIEKVQVVPHGNYISSYPNTIGRKEARQKLGFVGTGKTFLFFGQLRDYKGVDELLDAFADKALAESRLVVAGRPKSVEHQESLMARTKRLDNVLCYFDFIPPCDVQNFMNAADVVIFPFRDVFTSGSIMLAMSFGLPIIVPDVPSLNEIVDVMDGMSYDPDCRGSLLEVLRSFSMIENSPSGDANREYAAQCDWAGIARLTKQAYLA